MQRLFLFLVCLIPVDRNTEVSTVYKNTVDSIVQVKIGATTKGAGVAVKKNVIATASHVVKNFTTVKIILNDGNIVDGSVIFNDSNYDLALIKIKVEVKPLKLCLDPIIGEVAIAIGHPYKNKNTITTGIVSGLNREIETSVTTLKGMIQTSACLNPGNSGGALLNINGELLGLTVATQENGIGYAVNAINIKKALTVED